MKKSFCILLILAIGLTACGQTGPLYLPKNAPKVYDEPAAKAEEPKKEKKAEPEPPPVPARSKPTTDQ
ncbi:MAG: hypothetical protein FJ190_05090 [Gammaproteobacteria bacterium]|nr:hypothetical protein [Gammaproteobacteria bacterium]